MMLEILNIKNYRCFEDHTVNFHESTVVVGKNNAGKSTIIEALYIICWRSCENVVF
jgi:predicted ATP-dependent endonuclease of OLD family